MEFNCPACKGKLDEIGSNENERDNSLEILLWCEKCQKNYTAIFKFAGIEEEEDYGT